MNLPSLPDEISQERLNKALNLLGVPNERLMSVRIENGAVTVEYLRTDGAGDILMGERESLSRVRTEIHIRHDDVQRSRRV